MCEAGAQGGPGHTRAAAHHTTRATAASASTQRHGDSAAATHVEPAWPSHDGSKNTTRVLAAKMVSGAVQTGIRFGLKKGERFAPRASRVVGSCKSCRSVVPSVSAPLRPPGTRPPARAPPRAPPAVRARRREWWLAARTPSRVLAVAARASLAQSALIAPPRLVRAPALPAAAARPLLAPSLARLSLSLSLDDSSLTLCARPAQATRWRRPRRARRRPRSRRAPRGRTAACTPARRARRARSGCVAPRRGVDGAAPRRAARARPRPRRRTRRPRPRAHPARRPPRAALVEEGGRRARGHPRRGGPRAVREARAGHHQDGRRQRREAVVQVRKGPPGHAQARHRQAQGDPGCVSGPRARRPGGGGAARGRALLQENVAGHVGPGRLVLALPSSHPSPPFPVLPAAYYGKQRARGAA